MSKVISMDNRPRVKTTTSVVADLTINGNKYRKITKYACEKIYVEEFALILLKQSKLSAKNRKQVEEIFYKSYKKIDE